MFKDKRLNEKKFCFIICSNDELYLQECIHYIYHLHIPTGYEIEVISIRDAVSIASGYNEGMRASDAKYKIYLHHDVFIAYKDFLISILEIFHRDSNIGLIGMVGCVKMPANGIMWYTNRTGGVFKFASEDPNMLPHYKYSISHGINRVECVDGFLMVTSLDIPWREDLFTDFHYYDISQSMEFQRKGFKVVVPIQQVPWCYHDGRIMNLKNYDEYRKIGMKEYKEFFQLPRFQIVKKEEYEKEKWKLRVLLIANNQYEEVQQTLKSLLSKDIVKGEQIIVVDNGSEDELRHWLKDQTEYSYIQCNEILEGYGEILKVVIDEFITEEDLLLLAPGLTIDCNTISALKGLMRKNKNCGALSAGIMQIPRFGYKNEEQSIEIDNLPFEHTMELPFYGTLFQNKFLKSVKLESYDLPESILKDLSFQGIEKDFVFFKINMPLFYLQEGIDLSKINIYEQKFGYEKDKQKLKQYRSLTYFNTTPNRALINLMEDERLREMNVLEVGCDCGANLLEIQNRFPKASLYGVELNEESVNIARKIANVVVGNIEEKKVNYNGIRFDYIIFGDVLEHLRDPQGTIEYCKSLLKDNGKLLACIPNLMHYSVMKQLLQSGTFTYTDMGLLDRTHIHFFTYIEIIKMFAASGYTIERLSYTGGEQGIEEKDKVFVEQLTSLSNHKQKFMYYAFQYLVKASKEKKDHE